MHDRGFRVSSCSYFLPLPPQSCTVHGEGDKNEEGPTELHRAGQGIPVKSLCIRSHLSCQMNPIFFILVGNWWQG